jgi:hypothetical protein
MVNIGTPPPYGLSGSETKYFSAAGVNTYTDVINEVGIANIQNAYDGVDVGQSWTVGAGVTNVSAVTVNLGLVGVQANILGNAYVVVYDPVDSSTIGTSTERVSKNLSAGYDTFTFASPLAITASKLYLFTFCNPAATAGDGWMLRGSVANPYANGIVWLRTRPTGIWTGYAFDLTFITHTTY